MFDVRATLVGSQGLAGGSVTGVVYVRVWAYFASPLPTTPFNQLINLADDPGDGISFGAEDGFIANNDYTSVVYEQSTTVQLPIDRWTCLQMAMPSGTTDTARLYVDGQEVTDVAIAKATVQPRPTHVYIGLEWVGTVASQPAVDAWFDEIIVDDAPTSCTD
ncbi:MAG: hypothetical protein H0T79_15075 [Deltaproteobacteria bacterium]|nr:hypothetical protein [Deltaproteobacteria bacterium]